MFKTRFLSTLFFYGHKMGRFVVHIFITCTRKGGLMCISTQLQWISGGWKSRHTGRATTMVEPCCINFVPLFIHGRHTGRPLLVYHCVLVVGECNLWIIVPTPRLQRGVGGQLFVTINLSFFCNIKTIANKERNALAKTQRKKWVIWE